MQLSVKIQAAQRPCIVQVRVPPRGIVAKNHLFASSGPGVGLQQGGVGRGGGSPGHCESPGQGPGTACPPPLPCLLCLFSLDLEDFKGKRCLINSGSRLYYLIITKLFESHHDLIKEIEEGIRPLKKSPHAPSGELKNSAKSSLHMLSSLPCPYS